MAQRLKRYKRGIPHSYTFGVFPTLELLQHKPADVLGVVVHPKGSRNEGVAKIERICQEKRIPHDVDAVIHRRLGARENDYAIGIFRIAETGLQKDGNHVVLVNPSDRGNLGSIMRTMLGFDFQDLAIIEPATDIFHPETVRASMGALFQIRTAHLPDFTTYLKTYPRNIYTLMTNGSTPLPELDFQPPFGLVFGNESSGLPEEYARIGTSVFIPQSQRVDSLNLATSVSIALYQANLKRKR